MKLHFEALPFQEDATRAVVELFEGMEKNPSGFSFSLSGKPGALFQSELGFGNALLLQTEELYNNLQRVQDLFSLEATSREDFLSAGLRYTIEMETGTGKTYVYLNTILSLYKTYGWSKFIIIVPSIAIKEGVLKTLEITAEHFRNKYGIPLVKGSTYSLYQGTSPSALRNFSSTNQLQILVMNIQAFNKDTNIIHKEMDELNGHRPLDFIQDAKPILIIDEPQSVDNTDTAKQAIAELTPLFQLRYSATPKEKVNPVFRLGPVEAFQRKLVKHIQVRSLRVEGGEEAPFIRLVKTEYSSSKGFSAKLLTNGSSQKGISKKEISVKKKDQLEEKTKNSVYTNYQVDTISTEPGNEFVRFTNGTELAVGAEIGSLQPVLQEERINETIRAHLDKEKQFQSMGIQAKVLTLFFLDRVSNYRIFNSDGTTSLGKYGQVFEAAYKELIVKPEYQSLQKFPVESVHNGYFSGDKKKKGKSEITEWKDTKGDSSKDDDTYNLIMKDKERLLDPNEPLRFLFSHSALKEGWDNPNVFQICTLLETNSEFTKRQQIGRGLRLPVDAFGNRIYNDTLNKLTLVVSESFKKFSEELQKEYKEDAGVEFGKLKPNLLLSFISEYFPGLGESIQKREKSEELFETLKRLEYINEEGSFTEKLGRAFLDSSSFQLEGEFSDRSEVILEWLKGWKVDRFIQPERKPNSIEKNKALWDDPEFWKLWNIIRQKTMYRFQFDAKEVIQESIRRIKTIQCKPMKILIDYTEQTFTQGGISGNQFRSSDTRDTVNHFPLPDPLEYLQKETDLTRGSLIHILKASDSLDQFINNPHEYCKICAQHIKEVLREKGMKQGLEYIPLPDTYWEQHAIFREHFVSDSETVSTKNHGLYSSMWTDSDTEIRFAVEQENSPFIKVFTKLPRNFLIPTPVGNYCPDWAIVQKEVVSGEERVVYFVKETKGYKNFSEIRSEEEKQKIESAKKHFDVVFDTYKARLKAEGKDESEIPQFGFKVVLGTGPDSFHDAVL